jgi:2-methylaconitate cis-trans-isomerase PrpF
MPSDTVRGAGGDQVEIPCVFMRGGTSKALFFRSRDLPPPGPARDGVFKRAMGTPDEAQIDGMGGAKLNTSKIAVVDPSGRDDADVDYTFAQVELAVDRVGHEGNCGNISSAVGPFAIDEGLVPAVEPVTTVRIYNTNTGKVLVAWVPVANGRARVLGDCSIPGVPGTGAEILMDYAGSVGSATGALLPTGAAMDTVVLDDGRTVEASVCDLANPCVFMAASSLGLRGDERPEAIEADSALIATVEEVRGRLGQGLGFWPDWRAGALPAMPMAVIVAAAPPDDPADIQARLAGTGAICLAAASRVPGTVVNRLLGTERAEAAVVRIGHPSGTLEVRLSLDHAGPGGTVRFRTLGFARTARRLMAGTVSIPRHSAGQAMAQPPAIDGAASN